MNINTHIGKLIADDNDIVDYESLCKYIIRMGRSYSNIVQERKQKDDSIYQQIMPVLKKEFVLMLPVNSPRYTLN